VGGGGEVGQRKWLVIKNPLNYPSFEGEGGGENVAGEKRGGKNRIASEAKKAWGTKGERVTGS